MLAIHRAEAHHPVHDVAPFALHHILAAVLHMQRQLQDPQLMEVQLRRGYALVASTCIPRADTRTVSPFWSVKVVTGR